MRYNIEFRNERGSYCMKECTKPITQELLDNAIKFLEGWDIGHTKQIVIDVLEEKHDVKISLETRLAECGFSTRALNGMKCIGLETVSDRLAECGFSTRALNGMKCIGLETVSDLLSVPKTDLLKTHYIGKKTLSEIDRWVKDNEMLQKQLEHPWRSAPAQPIVKTML